MIVYYKDGLGLDFAINKKYVFAPIGPNHSFFRPIFTVGVNNY